MKTLKKILPEVLVIVFFAVISFAYFFPADIEGKILFRHDSSAGVGAGQEQSQYKERTGKMTRWTNSLFSGMPTYQMAPSYKSSDTLGVAMKAYHLWLPENVWYVFVYLLGFYILMRAFDFRRWMAHLGFLQLFLHHHRCWTYLEGLGSGLLATYDSGCGAGLSG